MSVLSSQQVIGKCLCNWHLCAQWQTIIKALQVHCVMGRYTNTQYSRCFQTRTVLEEPMGQIYVSLCSQNPDTKKNLTCHFHFFLIITSHQFWVVLTAHSLNLFTKEEWQIQDYGHSPALWAIPEQLVACGIRWPWDEMWGFSSRGV